MPAYRAEYTFRLSTMIQLSGQIPPALAHHLRRIPATRLPSLPDLCSEPAPARLDSPSSNDLCFRGADNLYYGKPQDGDSVTMNPDNPGGDMKSSKKNESDDVICREHEFKSVSIDPSLRPKKGKGKPKPKK